MSCTKSTARAIAAVMLFACAMQAAAQTAQPNWQDYLRRSTIERVQLSPDGTRLAVAERVEGHTDVVIRDATTLVAQTRLTSSIGGEIHTLRWLDEDRLLVSSNAVNARYNVAFNDPVMAIIRRVGKNPYVLPANFLATIDGDPQHLLVTKCTNYGSGGCYDAVHKVEIGHLVRMGDVIITAPDRDSSLYSDRHGTVRFAASVDEKANSKVHAHSEGSNGWTLINDSEKSGLTVSPIGIDTDGKTAFLIAERASGPSVVERYDFATGTRTDLYRNETSDPIDYIQAFDGETPIGAYYDATAPKPVIWNSTHPDAKAIAQIVAAFPGRIVSVTSASSDGTKAIVFVHGARDSGSWFLFDRATKKAKLVARARSWLTEERLPVNRAFTMHARDGIELHGVLTLPLNCADHDLPMVVMPHGGPHGIYDTGMYDQDAAILASQGYAVLRVNFRGSGGYGKQFEESGWMQWGRAMQDDVTDATKWAIEQGIANKDRICIAGWSYGGYAALMGAAREPALYRCAVGGAGPYDLAKMYKWGDIRRSDYGQEYLTKVIGKDKAVLAERSPVQQAAKIKVPVLLVHGRLDSRVDVAHARRVKNALEDAGVDVEFHEYVRAGHSLMREDDEQDYYTRLLAFLEKNTKPR